MRLTISITPTPDAGVSAAPLRNRFDELLANKVGSHKFSSRLSAIVVFLKIIDPRRGHIPDNVSYKRAENAIFTGVNIPHDQFMEADDAGRTDLFAAGVRASLEQVNEKHLPADDRAYILEKVAAVRAELLQQIGKRADASVRLAEGRSAGEPMDTTERTQIIVQWIGDQSPGAIPARQVHEMEEALEAESNGVFQVDGHDTGSGTINIFLFAEDGEAAVRRVIEIYESGRLPKGMRVGVEDSENGGAYRPVYPSELKTFDIWRIRR